MNLSVRIWFPSLLAVSLGISALEARYKMGDGRPEKVSQPTTGAPLNSPRSFSLEDERPYLEVLAAKYDAETDQLLYLRSLRHGYEELVPGLLVAQESQIEIGRVMRFRTEGATWHEIADRLRIELKPLERAVKLEIKELSRHLPERVMNETPTYRSHAR